MRSLLQASLSPQDIATLRAQGRAMSLDEAVAYALEENDGSTGLHDL